MLPQPSAHQDRSSHGAPSGEFPASSIPAAGVHRRQTAGPVPRRPLQHLLTLILDYPDNAELIAVYAGSILIGVSLNLIDEHHVGFYCSGINYNIPNKKIKPGYILHTQMIKHYKSLGKHEYDFLAGYAQYKQSLSTEVYNLKTLRLTKRNLRGTLIHLLRSLKQLFFKLKQKTKT